MANTIAPVKGFKVIICIMHTVYGIVSPHKVMNNISLPMLLMVMDLDWNDRVGKIYIITV